MELFISILFGALVGWIASLIMHKKGTFLINIVVGIVGGWLGGLLFGLIGLSAHGFIGNLIVSVIGACVLLLIVNWMNQKR